MRYVMILLALLAAACGGDGPTTPRDPRADAAGTYQLSTVNGGALPFLYYQNTAGRIEVVSGSMVLRADGSFTETLNFRTTYTDGSAPQNQAVIDNGTFTVVGSQITFSIPPTAGNTGVSWTGAVSAGVVTYTYDGTALRYQK